MNDFWNNISRYPRFLFSTIIGLILIILTPLGTLLKIKKFRFIVPLIFLFVLAGLFYILKLMTGF